MGGVVGWDMAAAFALGAALDVPPRAVAELLPSVEREMAKALNDKNKSD